MKRLSFFLPVLAALPLLAAEEQPQSLHRVEVIAEAESETTEGSGSYTTGGSRSATKLDLSLRETPQSVTVVTRERLDEQNMQTLRDVLDGTPGIYSYAWDSERVSFTSRGFDIDNLMYDGVPAVTNFSTDSVDEWLDTALYDRIEIVRGATGLMTGAGSPAASINLVRKHADSHQWRTALGMAAGSWNDLRLEADVSGPLSASGAVRARAVAVYQQRDSYQALYHSKRRILYGIIDADLSDRTTLSVGADFQDNQPTSVTWGSFPLFLSDGTLANWPRSVTTATDWTFWNRRKATAFAELQHAFGNGWSLRSSINWRRYTEDLALFYVYGFPDAASGEGLFPYAYRSDAEVIDRAIDLYASGPLTLFGREHQLLIGYNGSSVRNEGVEYPHGALADTGNFFRWDGSYPRPQFDSQGILLNDIDARQSGIYATGRFAVADTLKLIAGLRYSSWNVDYFYLYDSPTAGFHFDYQRTIPYAGLIYDFSTQFSAFASYTQIFKPQNSRDGSGKYLDPVDGSSYEFGIKGEHLDGRLNSSLTLFDTRQDNVAAPLFDTAGFPVMLPDGTQASYAIDGTRTRGFEFELAGELARGWNASLGWSRYQIQDAEGSDVRTFVPRTLIRTFTSWKPAAVGGRLTLGGGVNWQSQSSTPVGAPTGSVDYQQGAVTLVSLMARWQITPQLSLQLNGSNLLDKKYFVLDEYGNLYYGAPVSYAASVDWKF